MIKIAIGLAAITVISLSHTAFASSLPQEKDVADKEKPKNILKIDDFLPEKKKWTLSTGVSILNKSGDGSSPLFYLNEISPGHYILNKGTQTYQKETNGVSAHSSLIYGITDELAVGATVNGQWQNNQYTFDDGKKAVNNKYQFNGVGLGGSYQTYLFSDYTVFFGGINIKESKIKSYTLGTSLNWIYDPLVLSLSVGYLDGISRERFSNNYTAYTTSGSVIFAVNPEVNIRWGFSKDFIYTQKNLVSQKSWSSNTSLLIGTIVNLTDRVSTDINVKGGVGNNKTSTVSVSLSYKI